MMRSPIRALFVLLSLCCASCGGGLSGAYEEESGLGRLEFEADGTVYVSLLGATVVGEYELDGAHVLVKGPNGTQVLTRNGRHLDGGPGLRYVAK